MGMEISRGSRWRARRGSRIVRVTDVVSRGGRAFVLTEPHDQCGRRTRIAVATLMKAYRREGL